MVKYIETCRNIFKTERPDIIILKGDGPPPTRTFTTIAREQGVPTLMIQHGRQDSSRKFISITDHVATWGEYSAEFFRGQGYPEEFITVTGAPHLDHLTSLKGEPSSLRDTLNIPSSDSVITVVSQPVQHADRRDLIEAAINAVSDLVGTTLVLRPHPREDVSLHETMSASTQANIVVADTVEILDLIRMSDLLIGIRSTALFEASLMNVPAFPVEFLTEKPDEFYKANFRTIIDREELKAVVERTLENSDYRNEVLSKQPHLGRQFAHNEDGRGTQRIVDLVEKILTNPSNNVRKLSF